MKLSTQILLAFSIVIAISVIVSYSNYQLSLKVQRNTNFVSSSETIIRNSTTLHKSTLEIERGNQFAPEVSHHLKSPVRGIYHVMQGMEEDLEPSTIAELHNYQPVVKRNDLIV